MQLQHLQLTKPNGAALAMCRQITKHTRPASLGLLCKHDSFSRQQGIMPIMHDSRICLNRYSSRWAYPGVGHPISLDVYFKDEAGWSQTQKQTLTQTPRGRNRDTKRICTRYKSKCVVCIERVARNAKIVKRTIIMIWPTMRSWLWMRVLCPL